LYNYFMDKKEVLNRMTEELFAMAEDLGLLLTDIAFTPYGKLRMHRIPRTTYYFRLKKFEKHGLIKKVKREYGASYILTQKAKDLRVAPRVKISRSDGLSTIVMFDIPEEKHKARDNFRRFLLKNGYTQVQKSVFISPFKIFDEMMVFIRELGIVDNVTFISGMIDRSI